MSVEQLIRELAQLSAAEQAEIAQFLRQVGGGDNGRSKLSPRASALAVDLDWLDSLPQTRATQSADVYIREDRDSRD